MVYPSFFGGYVFNDNVYATSTNRVAQSGVRLNPSFMANLDNGLHKTTITFNGDAQLYPGAGGQTRDVAGQPQTIYDNAASNATGGATFSHVWTPMNDLTVSLYSSYSRQSGLNGASIGISGAAPSGISQPYISSIGTYSGTQQYSNQFNAMASIEKKFTDRVFVVASAGGQYVTYDNTPVTTTYATTGNTTNNASAGQNGGSFTFSVRNGFWVTPQVYGYVEPGLELRRYEISTSDTNGYRIVAGAGSEMISLFKGEIYGGIQSQASDQGLFNQTVAPNYGARVSYLPTPDLTLAASVSSSLGPVAPTKIGYTTPLGVLASFQPSAVTQTQQVLLQGDYIVNSYTTAHVGGGLGKTETSTPTSGAIVWSGSAGVSYTFWRNVALTFNYQFTKTSVSQNLATTGVLTPTVLGYVQNTVSTGLTYRY